MTTLMTTMATTTTIVTDDDVDDTARDDDADDNDDDVGNDASSMMSNEGDNRNHDNGKDACASTAMTPVHWRRRRHWQRVLSRGRGKCNKIIPCFICCHQHFIV